MRLAVFSDLHGKILLPFKLVDAYQQETGEPIDAILQCGDIGCYPDLNNLDKATLKHAKTDRDELGFHDYFTQEIPAIKAFLETLNIDMICVRGNHEDHDYLDQLEQEYASQSLFPIDIYNRVYVCKSGHRQTLKIGTACLSYVGIGRIGDRKGRTDQRFIQAYEKEQIKQLLRTKDSFDVLITHDKEDSSERGYGMAEIRKLLDQVIFHYHFYGHTGEPYKEELAENGITTSIKVKELEFNQQGVLEEGVMIILEKEGEALTTKVVPPTITNRFTKGNWHHL